MRLVSGLLKGGLIGFCVGALSWRIGMTGLPAFIDYGIIGALVAAIAGRYVNRLPSAPVSLDGCPAVNATCGASTSNE